MSLLARYPVRTAEAPKSQTTYNEAYITRKIDEASKYYASVKHCGDPATVKAAYDALCDAKELLRASVEVH